MLSEVTLLWAENVSNKLEKILSSFYRVKGRTGLASSIVTMTIECIR
jgi:hypothetical protein